ncbi:hypothetical protein F5Y14DRAFT_297723 [Nemania sp. NC0429]|nr:hypothetical protein F5Y14DRAFT_297723 [Nemania sp. NC0429]
MAKRRVIADSEDEDEGEDVLLLHVDDSERPEPEPLSPNDPAPLSRIERPDVTDPSLIANTYDDQQSLAVQQSHLIENIVRQSQRASASSGDVSLPPMKRGRRIDPSSGTDVTSPVALSRPRNHVKRSSGAASEFTTPRKSAGQEWEIPSSPEDAPASRNARRLGSGKKTSENNKRTRPRIMSSPVAAELFVIEETMQQAPPPETGVDNQDDGSVRAGVTSAPAANRINYSHHDLTLPDPAKIYVAQSNLTTMQKLEYQKVSVSINGYGPVTGSFQHQKSSGATTIAYSTPSGYSSVPPLPWEESPAQPTSPRRNEAPIISSSPDVIGAGFEIEVPTPNLDMDCVSPVKPRAQKSASNGKRKATQITEEDELGQDGVIPPELYEHRTTKRRSLTTGVTDSGGNAGEPEGIPHKDVTQTQDPLEPSASDLPATAPSEPQTEKPVKKRGRKKKQHTKEILPTVTDTNEDSYLNQDSAPPQKVVEAELPLEQPKKKRGRPRKSGPSKTVEETLPTSHIASELPPTARPQRDNSPNEPASASRKRVNTEQEGEREKDKAATEAEGVPSADIDRLPLKEVDSNPETPSRPISEEAESTKTKAELDDKMSTPKTKSKEAAKLPTSQSKVTYRVGLSKRSRIAPLLKTIRK